MILINGVSFRSINISFPKPEPVPSASALIYLPFSFDPKDQLVLPFTFFSFKFFNSSAVNSKTFTISPPKIKDALGSETTTISVNGIHAVGDTTIAIDGFNADTAGSLKAGDFLKFASHTKVYMVVSDVTPSSNAATVTIEPPLIEALADDSTVTYDDVTFTVYLEGTVQTYDLGFNDLYNYEFDVCEAF